MNKHKNKRKDKKLKANPFNDHPIGGFKIIRRFLPMLDTLRSHADCPNRILHYDQYVSLLLLHYFNPVLSSLRALQRASTLKDAKKRLGIPTTSLGSLSEASRVFDPELLVPIISDLASRTGELNFDRRLKDIDLSLVAVDGTILKALPKMAWALWLDNEHRAAKMHLEFDILKGAPLRGELTHANASEVANLKAALKPHKLYIIDAGYADYNFLGKIPGIGSSFVARLHDNAVYETIEERQLSEADREANIEFDRVAWLGSKGHGEHFSKPVRIIQIHCRDLRADFPGYRRKSRVSSKKTFRTNSAEYTMLLVTDRMDLPAELIGLCFRYRWHVELFFRWFKCVLGFKHLVAHSENGMMIQVYCALIAGLIIRLWTGRKPTKRTFEMICLYFQGWARLSELEEHIAKLKQDEKSLKIKES